jgi:hypothetical protein
MTTPIVSKDEEPVKRVAVERKMSLFGQSLPFAQAFPMVAGLEATVWIRPFGSTEQNPQERHFGLRNPPGEHVLCPKKGCTNGGWCLGDVMRDMIAKRETHRQVEGKCNGKQFVVGPKYRDCGTHFTAEIDLAYKPEAAKVAA